MHRLSSWDGVVDFQILKLISKLIDLWRVKGTICIQCVELINQLVGAIYLSIHFLFRMIDLKYGLVQTFV